MMVRRLEGGDVASLSWLKRSEECDLHADARDEDDDEALRREEKR